MINQKNNCFINVKESKMKKLNELLINSGKLIKNDELLTLKGGNSSACTCLCWTSFPTHHWLGYLVSEEGTCMYDCRYAFPGLSATGDCNGV
jgi:hypothetical protein